MSSDSITIDECLKWFGYASLPEVPALQLIYRPGSNCYENCQLRSAEIHQRWAFRYNVVLDDAVSPDAPYPLDRLAALINLKDYRGYESFLTYAKSFSDGERLRLIRRAENRGYFVEQFPLQLFAADRFEIHHSKEIRQGRPVDGNLLASVDDMDGVANQYGLFTDPRCHNFLQRSFGVFLAAPGRMQGQFVVGKKLVGYIMLYCSGNVGSYIWIIGHAEHLPYGVMDLCHHHIIRTLLDERPGWAAKVEFVRYAGMEDGLTGLFHWKRRAGFRPYRLYARPDEVNCGNPRCDSGAGGGLHPV